MKLKFLGPAKYSRVYLTPGRSYKVVGGHGADNSPMVNVYKMITGTGKPVQRLRVKDDRGETSISSIDKFDLSPLQQNIMTNKLQQIISEQYFTEEKIKEIAKIGGNLQKKIKTLQKELEELEETFEDLGEAVEMGDVEAVEKAIDLLSK